MSLQFIKTNEGMPYLSYLVKYPIYDNDNAKWQESINRNF